MKIASWNINALKAHETSFREAMTRLKPDIFCLQEIRVREYQATFPVAGYLSYMNPGDEKGYYGTGVYIRDGIHPLSLRFDEPMHGSQYHGNVIAVELDEYFVVCSYWPYSSKSNGVDFLPYRITWNEWFEGFIHKLQCEKPVIICGDMNIVREEIDAFDGKIVKNAGCFYPAEHQKFDNLLINENLIDTYRELNPFGPKFSTWPYSKDNQYRLNNEGFRIDYFLASAQLMPRIKSSEIHTDIMGSDHCPISLTIE